jgi:hypothetical protein
VVDLKLALEIKYWTSLMVFTIVGLSLGLYIGYMWVSDNFSSLLLYKTTGMLYSCIQFYACVLLSIGVVAFLDMSINYYKATYKTTITEFLKTLIKKKRDHEDQYFKFLDPHHQEEPKIEMNILSGLEHGGNMDFNRSLVVNEDDRRIGNPKSTVNNSATKR